MLMTVTGHHRSMWVLRDNETYQPRVLAHMASREKPFLSTFPSTGRTYNQICQDPSRAQYKDSPPRGDTAQTKGILEDTERVGPPTLFGSLDFVPDLLD